RGGRTLRADVPGCAATGCDLALASAYPGRPPSGGLRRGGVPGTMRAADGRRCRLAGEEPVAQDDLPPSASDLIGAFADHLRLERRLSAHTVSAYRDDRLQLATLLHRAGSSVEGADQRILRRFLAQQHPLGYARASIARRVGAIRTFYRWAAAEGRIDPDPAQLLGRPKVVNRLPTVLRASEATILVEAPVAPRDDPVGQAGALRDRAVLEVLYGSGIRVGEAAGLTVPDVDLARARIRVLGKGSKEREVPLSEDAVEAVAAWIREGRPRMAPEGSAALFFN